MAWSGNPKVVPHTLVGICNGTGITGGGDLTESRSISVIPNTTVQQIEVQKNSGSVSSIRKTLNFIEGSNVTITVLDDNANDRSNVTVASSGGGTLVSNYRTILHGRSSHIAGKTANKYALALADAAGVTGTGTLYCQSLIHIDAADYTSINGSAVVLRLKTMLLVNDVAPTGNFTFGLYPVTRPSTSGGAGLNILTLGTVVSGSTALYTTPAADSMTTVNSSDFSLPANGFYVLGVETTATVATSSLVWLFADLQIKNA